jgi:hypothetical protein
MAVSYYTTNYNECKEPLPEPTFICDECGGGSWKKVKKGSEVEKYLVFCRCDDDLAVSPPPRPLTPPPPPPSPSLLSTSPSSPPPPLDKLQKQLRSRLKKNHHTDRKWTENFHQTDDD